MTTQWTLLKATTQTGLMAIVFVLVTGTTDFLFLNFAASAPEAQVTTHYSTFSKQHGETRLLPSVTGKRVVPFGVFDVQSGHGHGQWRDKPENLLR